MPNLRTIKLFNLNITNATKAQALTTLFKPNKIKKTAAFINAHCINVAAKNETYRWALDRADILLPDGSGMNIAARLHGEKLRENLNGTDLFPHLCQCAAEARMPVFFFGSKPRIAARAAQHAATMTQGLEIAGTRDGYFDAEQENSIIDEINASGAEMVLVALGVPLQDVWIARNRHRLNARLVLGVGAQFDFWSGAIARAPKLMRQMGLEWAFRLALEPRRLAKRYLWGNGRFLLHALCDVWSTKRPSQTRTKWKRRFFDITLACAAITALSPLMLVLALFIKLGSRGTVLFKQTRIGEGGVPFEVYKFRSMYQDAATRLDEVRHLNNRDSVFFKARQDPRVTKIGRLLRRYSLDELPQIFNVIKGDMSIVGPRPSLPQEVEAFPPEAMSRLSTKPGITGLWQVSGRAEIRFEKMIEMDSAYATSPSIFMDIALLFLTLGAVITGRGAY